MRRVLTATMLGIAVASSAFCSAQAAGTKSAKAGVSAGRVASFVVGTAFGTPVSIIRTQYKDVIDFTNGMTGGSKNPWVIAAVQPLTFIPAVANGLFEGPIHAARNAWLYSSDEPFGPRTFSLGELDR